MQDKQPQGVPTLRLKLVKETVRFFAAVSDPVGQTLDGGTTCTTSGCETTTGTVGGCNTFSGECCGGCSAQASCQHTSRCT